MKNVVAIIQARMASTRLPGKVLLPLGKRLVIEWVIAQALAAKQIDKLVVATTDSDNDDKLADFLSGRKVNCFRGSEADVLDRYYQCALSYKADVIVRITADCPLLDPEVIDQVILGFKQGRFDYYSNINPPTYPDGLDCEVFSMQALERAWNEAKLASEREHVTPFIRNHPELFTLGNLLGEKDYSKLRWTLDTQEDFDFLSGVVNQLVDYGPFIGHHEVLAVLNQHQDLGKVNAHIKRNEGLEKSIKEDYVFKAKIN